MIIVGKFHQKATEDVVYGKGHLPSLTAQSLGCCGIEEGRARSLVRRERREVGDEIDSQLRGPEEMNVLCPSLGRGERILFAAFLGERRSVTFPCPQRAFRNGPHPRRFRVVIDRATEDGRERRFFSSLLSTSLLLLQLHRCQNQMRRSSTAPFFSHECCFLTEGRLLGEYCALDVEKGKQEL